MYVFVHGQRGWRGGYVDDRIGCVFYQLCGNRGMLDICLCVGCGGVGGVSGEWVGSFVPGSGGVGGVMSV